MIRFQLTIALPDGGTVTLFRDCADFHAASDAGIYAAIEAGGRLCGVMLAPVVSAFGRPPREAVAG